MPRFFGQFYLDQRFTGQFRFPCWLKGTSHTTGRSLYHLLTDASDQQAAKSFILTSIDTRLGVSPIDLKLYQRPDKWRPAPCKYPRPRWYTQY